MRLGLRKILRLPKFFSGKATRFGLDMPSMVARILIHKLLYLHRLLTTQHNNIAARILTTLTCIDSTEIAIVQQCHFLEGLLHIEKKEGMSLTEKVIRMSISDAEEVIKMVKAEVTRADHQRLIDSVESESSVALLVHIREVTTWSRIWDQALDWGPRAVEDIKSLLRLLCSYSIVYCMTRNVLHVQNTSPQTSNMYAKNVTLMWT